MKQILKLGVGVGLLLFILSACSVPKEMGSKKYRNSMVGTWTSGGDTTIIVRDKQSLKVTLVRDYEELFEVQEYGWKDGEFYWTYLVPSTDYVVKVKTKGVEGDIMKTRWSNSYDTGNQDLHRVKN